jgi:CheY-like chemotaxis protein
VDAVIVDYLMPRATGVELIRRLFRIKEVDAYLTSGYSRGAISDPQISSLFSGFISKPFTGEDLQEALSGASPGRQDV